ncbi:hypothetical protein TrLO_g6972 [Triparma laevis f. longispina]|uniref:Uncharacterized protein n=1 Tax=Triparma laevis f. longispina TaxID=1714387 RepID=A0A9W7AG03_9STRA|nr:hypothetical protein TrLO_g6972 [Triparma laevis f. longispina]
MEEFIDATKACLSFILSTLLGLFLLYLLLHPSIPTLPLITIYDTLRSSTRLYLFGPYAAKANNRKWFVGSMSLDIFWGTFQALFIQFDGSFMAVCGCVLGKVGGIFWRWYSGSDRFGVFCEKIWKEGKLRCSSSERKVRVLPLTNDDVFDPPMKTPSYLTPTTAIPLRKSTSLNSLLTSNQNFHALHPPCDSFSHIPYIFPEQRSHLLLLDLTSTLITSLTTRIHICLLILLPSQSLFPPPNNLYFIMILIDILSLLTLTLTYKAGVSGSKLVEFAFVGDVKFWIVCCAAITMFVYSVGEPLHGFGFLFTEKEGGVE